MELRKISDIDVVKHEPAAAPALRVLTFEEEPADAAVEVERDFGPHGLGFPV